MSSPSPEFKSLNGAMSSAAAQQLAAAGFAHVVENTFSKFAGDATLFLEVGENGVMASAFLPEGEGGKFIDAPVFLHGEQGLAVAHGIRELEGVMAAREVSGSATVSAVQPPADIVNC